MRQVKYMLSIVVLCYGALPGLRAGDDAYKEKFRSLPDFSQYDKRFGGYAYAAAAYCGPCAVSNALIWLDLHGFDNLVDGSGSPEDQYELINYISGSKYINISDKGTTAFKIMQGLETYIIERNHVTLISYKGRFKGGKYKVGEIPDIQWLKKGIKGNSNIVLKIGRYTFDRKKNEYTRLSGHYVTMAGYIERNNKLFLVIHDPAQGNGTVPRQTVIKLVPLSGGFFASHETYPKTLVDGFYKVVHSSPKKDVYILDGAITFTLE